MSTHRVDTTSASSSGLQSFDPFAQHPFTSLQSPRPSDDFQNNPYASALPIPMPPGHASSYNVHLKRAQNAPPSGFPSPSSLLQSTPSPTSPLPHSSSSPPSYRPQSSTRIFTDYRGELERRRLMGQVGEDDLPTLKKRSKVYPGF